MKAATPQLLTIPKAAIETGLPYSTLRRLVNEDIVPSITLPGRRSRLVEVEDVRAVLDASKSGSVPGSNNETEPLKTAQNKQSRKRAVASKNTANSQWINEFTPKRTTVS